jgi:hypothetical protein
MFTTTGIARELTWSRALAPDGTVLWESSKRLLQAHHANRSARFGTLLPETRSEVYIPVEIAI